MKKILYMVKWSMNKIKKFIKGKHSYVSLSNHSFSSLEVYAEACFCVDCLEQTKDKVASVLLPQQTWNVEGKLKHSACQISYYSKRMIALEI